MMCGLVTHTYLPLVDMQGLWEGAIEYISHFVSYDSHHPSSHHPTDSDTGLDTVCVNEETCVVLEGIKGGSVNFIISHFIN